jgi:hypothetical protein
MFDPYYPQYPSYIVNPQKKNNPPKPYPLMGLSDIKNNYWPAGSDSLEAMVHDTKTYGLDVTDLIMKDKVNLLGTTARLLRNHIDARTNLMNDNLKDIDDKIVKCDCYLLQIEAFPYFVNKMIEAKRTNLSNEITRLESERRGEIVTAWSDKIRLYSELIEALGEYQSHVRRSQLISGE